MGTGDSVRCFYCGVTLRNWREHDDPWLTHVRFRYSCDYVTAVKGKDFVITSLCNLVKVQTDSSLSNECVSPSFSNSGVESRETRGQGNSPSQTTELATKLEQVKTPRDTAEATNSDEPPMPDHQFLRRFPLCTVCSERSADTIFLPCGHLCTCEVCADSLSQCCLCRDRIRGTAHVYFE